MQSMTLNTLDKLQNLEISTNKLTARYTGKGNHTQDVGAIRATAPLPKNTRIAYFEARIVSCGTSSEICIGIADSSFSLCRHLGKETSSFSYGYYSKDGKRWNNCNSAPYGPALEVNDIVGCGLRHHSKELFFCRNGKYLGTAFRNVIGDFYPAISLHGNGDCVELNFGQSSFCFDVEGLMIEEREHALKEIAAYSVPIHSINELILDYFHTCGYIQSLAALEKIIMKSRHYDVNDANQREDIRKLIMGRKIEEALQGLQKLANNAANSSKNKQDALNKAKFTLYCQGFIELIRENNLQAAIAYARTNLQTTEPTQRQHLMTILGLLAYTDATSSQCPISYLLNNEQLELTAHVVNSCLLEINGYASRSAFENLMCQLQLCRDTERSMREDAGDLFSLGLIVKHKNNLTMASI